MMNKFSISTIGFTLGVIFTWAFMAYWNNPIHNWSTVIEDRCMYYEARSNANSVRARQAIWAELEELNEIAYTTNSRVNNMMDPHASYMNDLVRDAAEMLFFAEYMWEENFYPMNNDSSQIDLPDFDKK